MAAAKNFQTLFKKLTPQQTQPNVWQKTVTADVKSDVDELSKLRLKDIGWRLENRQSIKRFLFALLVGQNLFVFGVFGIGMWFGKIAGLEAVFSTLVGGTLIETTSLIYIIVKWLYSEIQYKDQNKIPN